MGQFSWPLTVMPNGAKYWRIKYRFLGKEKRPAFGVYPEVSLKEARLKRDEASKLLADNIDPNTNKPDHLLEAVHHFNQCNKAVFSGVGAVFGLPAANVVTAGYM